MRKFAVLCILLGIGLAALLPWAQSNLSGNEVAMLSVYERNGTGWQSGTVTLSRDDNPVRVRINAKYLVDAKLPPNGLPITIRVSGTDGVVLDGTVSLSTNLQGSAPEQEKTVRSTAPVFAIAEAGEYLIEVNLAPNAADSGVLDPGLSSVSVSVIGNAVDADNEYQMPGIVLAIFGVYLLMRSRHRKSGVVKNSPAGESKSRWGRGKK